MRKILKFILPIAGCSLLIAAQGVVAGGLAKKGTFESTIFCVTGPMETVTVEKLARGNSFDLVSTPMAKEGELLYGTSARCVGSSTTVGKVHTEDVSCLHADGDGDRFLAIYSGRFEVGTRPGREGRGRPSQAPVNSRVWRQAEHISM